MPVSLPSNSLCNTCNIDFCLDQRNNRCITHIPVQENRNITPRWFCFDLFCLYINSFIWFKWLIYLHLRDCFTAPALNSEVTIKYINKIDWEQKHNKMHIVCLILGKAHKCNHKCPYFNDFSAKSPLNSEHVILHYDDVTWTSWSIKSPVIRLFV